MAHDYLTQGHGGCDTCLSLHCLLNEIDLDKECDNDSLMDELEYLVSLFVKMVRHNLTHRKNNLEGGVKGMVGKDGRDATHRNINSGFVTMYRKSIFNRTLLKKLFKAVLRHVKENMEYYEVNTESTLSGKLYACEEQPTHAADYAEAHHVITEWHNDNPDAIKIEFDDSDAISHFNVFNLYDICDLLKKKNVRMFVLDD